MAPALAKKIVSLVERKWRGVAWRVAVSVVLPEGAGGGRSDSIWHVTWKHVCDYTTWRRKEKFRIDLLVEVFRSVLRYRFVGVRHWLDAQAPPRDGRRARKKEIALGRCGLRQAITHTQQRGGEARDSLSWMSIIILFESTRTALLLAIVAVIRTNR